MKSPTLEETKDWLISREIGFSKIAEARRSALADLDESAAVAIFEQLCSDQIDPDASRPLTGLVTQQAWFSRSRAHTRK